MIFLWVVNATFTLGFELFVTWGYSYLCSIEWIKKTKNDKFAISNGYLLMHAKETCLVGFKGSIKFDKDKIPPVIIEERRRQSEKPYELYNIIENLIPNGKYIELFGRENNLRENWTTIGNEL